MKFIFEPEILQAICKDVLKETKIVPNNNSEKLNELFNVLTMKLEQEYPGYIITKPRDWIFNNAGGAMGSLTFLHGSLKEYLILFGTPIGTHGHSGRYRRAHVYDIMLDGEMLCLNEDDIQRHTFLPGDMAHLVKKKAKSYRVPDYAWMLEYSRGGIPSMIKFGIGDNLFSNFDYRSSNRLIRKYFGFVFKRKPKRNKKQDLPISNIYKQITTQVKI